jgi:hypothetical protein
VRLRVPPPLDTPLEVRRTGANASLHHGDTVVAEARPAAAAPELPRAPTWHEAEAATRRFRGFDAHWFPACFVCGPERDHGDGLRIFPGPLDGRDGLVACPWVPDASLAASGAGGRVAPEFVWAALDCPGAFAFPPPAAGVILLGELAVELRGEVAVGERCVLVGWEIAHTGRKHTTGTALFDAAGTCRGAGVGTWFEVA